MAKSIKQSINVQNAVQPAPQLSTTARPVDTYVQPEKPRELQTAEALKSLGQGLGGLAQNYRETKEANDIAGLDAEIALAEQAVADGSIDNIRDYKEWPQYSPAVQLKLNSRLGQKEGVKSAQELQSFFSENPKHLVDDELRAAAIQEHRPQVSDGASKAYAGMMAAAYDNATNSMINAGMNLRAQEVKKELRESDGAAVDSLFLDPNGFDPAALDALDAELQKSSLLSKPELKALYAERFIQAADAANSTELLDQFPQKFGSLAINAKVANAKRSITNRINAEASAERTKRERVRTDNYRSKSQDIVRAAADGTLNPQDYRDEDDARLFELATKYTTATVIPPVQSSRNVQTLKQNIENYVRSDGKTKLEGAGESVDKDELLDLIQNDKTINPADKIKLMNSIDSIMKVDALQSSRVYSEGLSDANSIVTAAGKAVWAEIVELNGSDIKGELRSLWKDRMADLYQEYVEANEGQEPPNSVLNEMVDQADRALQKRVDRLRAQAMGEDIPEESPQASTNTTAPSNDSSIPVQAPLIPKVGAIVDGYRFKGGNVADESNWELVTSVAGNTTEDGGAA